MPRHNTSTLWPGACGLGWRCWPRCSRWRVCGVGFMVAPSDAQQGQAYRIIYIHVPVSLMAMIIYLAMAFWSVLGLVFNTRL